MLTFISKLLQQFEKTHRGHAYDVYVIDNIVYVADLDGGLEIIKILR